MYKYKIYQVNYLPSRYMLTFDFHFITVLCQGREKDLGRRNYDI